MKHFYNYMHLENRLYILMLLVPYCIILYYVTVLLVYDESEY
jgi:hypothetical protein